MATDRRLRVELVRKSLNRQIEEAAAEHGVPVERRVNEGRLEYKLGPSTWMTPGDAARRLGVDW